MSENMKKLLALEGSDANSIREVLASFGDEELVSLFADIKSNAMTAAALHNKDKDYKEDVDLATRVKQLLSGGSFGEPAALRIAKLAITVMKKRADTVLLKTAVGEATGHHEPSKAMDTGAYRYKLRTDVTSERIASVPDIGGTHSLMSIGKFVSTLSQHLVQSVISVSSSDSRISSDDIKCHSARQSIWFFPTRCTGIVFKENAADVLWKTISHWEGYLASLILPTDNASAQKKRKLDELNTNDRVSAAHCFTEAPPIVLRAADDAFETWKPKDVSAAKHVFSAIKAARRVEHITKQLEDGERKTFYALYIDQISNEVWNAIPNNASRSQVVRSVCCRIMEHVREMGGFATLELKELGEVGGTLRTGFWCDYSGLCQIKSACEYFLDKEFDDDF